MIESVELVGGKSMVWPVTLTPGSTVGLFESTFDTES